MQLFYQLHDEALNGPDQVVARWILLHIPFLEVDKFNIKLLAYVLVQLLR